MAPTEHLTARREAPDPGARRSTRIGFIVNPIAGMGGPVALKGTDDLLEEARERGAEPVAHDRAVRFLRTLGFGVTFLTCSGPMGQAACEEACLPYELLVEVTEPTGAGDTREAARKLAAREVSLIVFLGGDGTAMDVAEAIGHRIPVLGVPSGVKMNSACFAETPEAAALIAGEFLRGRLEVVEREVVEVDEAALEASEVTPVSLSSLLVPEDPRVQPSKAEPGGTVDGVIEAIEDIAQPGQTLVLGPGSTLHQVKQALVGEGTLLGVDVVQITEDGAMELTLRDATAQDLEEVPDEATLVLSPIGGQGFVVGRGNQQVTPGLLGRLGWERLVVVATSEKLSGLPVLRADTGDPDLDAKAPGHLQVVTGPGFRRMVELRAGR